MYWYISFLRPPPVTAPASSTILITPQVANDLRTELRYDPTPLVFTWQRVSPSSDPPLPFSGLTTFLPPESTYRPIPISLPKVAKKGERWRLGIFSNPAIGSLDQLKILGSLLEHPDVVGVWSEGMLLTSPVLTGKNDGKVGSGKGKGKEEDMPKQGRISREWALDKSTTLRIVEQTSFDLDKKIWDSGLALSAWLWQLLRSSLSTKNKYAQSLVCDILEVLRSEGGEVLELGSGTGLVSIALSLAMTQTDRRGVVKITATDLESAMDLMDENIALNQHLYESVVLSAKVLDWERPLPPEIAQNRPRLVIAADVTYNTASFPSLLRTISSLLMTPEGNMQPVLLLAYKERDPGERELWDMLRDAGVNMKLVDKVRGCEEGEEGTVEIWSGTCHS
ncbi:hypothetical protein TREMEDRAFT_70051 [Tremella mesenterica DSM 1558]|uniref:uncharacterized protein n=1 Tax=Tremella mesenterica (strain ATCC 24925 / CBS 8224 / DSM 1558 / NBRC 9311 / NRRL Y-6157 / RJB 2259-6 / UBC 559-6) TaxID=578456 RepID=UPI00032BB58F|nr:uncharacterized protein TREMEDRAFT_70051 [Tremella mesenterica DSM 1558]EIW66798.1 hypothetical protein TREMEDRAFT_70051 [Tremella mesenterica DSM 1558]